MKKIMILGAGRGQVGLYKQSKEMGLHSIAVTIPGDYPALEFADEVAYVDIRDKEAVLNVAREKEIDGIVTSCMDIALATVGFVCDNLNLQGISYEAAKTSTDKFLMKKAFMEKDVRTAKYVRVDKGADPLPLVADFDYPIIVKPVDLAGSRGINIVNSEDGLQQAVDDTMATTAADYCIIEEFLIGTEFSATAFVENGKVVFTLPTGDVRYGDKGEVPGGHYLPYEASEEAGKDFERQISAGIMALGLDNCAVNADVMLVGDDVYILEMTGRMGANCMPELSSIYLGSDMYGMIIKNAIGEDICLDADNIPCRPCYARMIASENAGILEEVILPKMEGCTYSLFKNPGDKVNAFSCTDDYIGQAIAEAETLGKAKERVDAFVDTTIIRLANSN